MKDMFANYFKNLLNVLITAFLDILLVEILARFIALSVAG